MEKLSKQEMEKILGGGYWIPMSNGQWIYVDGDEENEDDGIIFG